MSINLDSSLLTYMQLLKDNEHLPKLAKSHGMKVISADFIPYWLYEQVVETGKHEGSGDLTTIMYNITQTLFNASEDNEIYLLKMKKEIDKLNSSNYDYIISDIILVDIMYKVLGIMATQWLLWTSQITMLQHYTQ